MALSEVQKKRLLAELFVEIGNYSEKKKTGNRTPFQMLSYVHGVLRQVVDGEYLPKDEKDSVG